MFYNFQFKFEWHLVLFYAVFCSLSIYLLCYLTVFTHAESHFEHLSFVDVMSMIKRTQVNTKRGFKQGLHCFGHKIQSLFSDLDDWCPSLAAATAILRCAEWMGGAVKGSGVGSDSTVSSLPDGGAAGARSCRDEERSPEAEGTSVLRLSICCVSAALHPVFVWTLAQRLDQKKLLEPAEEHAPCPGSPRLSQQGAGIRSRTSTLPVGYHIWLDFSPVPHKRSSQTYVCLCASSSSSLSVSVFKQCLPGQFCLE